MKIKILTIAAFTTIMMSCGGEAASDESVAVVEDVAPVEEVVMETEEVAPESDALSIGVGPITAVELGEIDDALVEKGKEVYKASCTACHKIGKRAVGPALKGVTERRSPEWIMNMILNPEGMVAEDPTAKALLAEYLAPMANQSLSEEEARAILEFLRTKN